MCCLHVLISTNMEQPLRLKEIKSPGCSDSLGEGHSSEMLFKIRGFTELHYVAIKSQVQSDN